MRIIAVTLALLIYSTTANAGLSEWCLDAYSSGNIEEGNRWATLMLEGERTFTGKEIGNAVKCVERFTGKKHQYNPKTKKFPTMEEISATASLERQLKDRVAKNKEEAAIRQVQAQAKLIEACNELYLKDESSAVTNQLCYQTFVEFGLPE